MRAWLTRNYFIPGRARQRGGGGQAPAFRVPLCQTWTGVRPQIDRKLIKINQNQRIAFWGCQTQLQSLYPKSRLTQVPIESRNIEFGPKWIENLCAGDPQNIQTAIKTLKTLRHGASIPPLEHPIVARQRPKLQFRIHSSPSWPERTPLGRSTLDRPTSGFRR